MADESGKSERAPQAAVTARSGNSDGQQQQPQQQPSGAQKGSYASKKPQTKAERRALQERQRAAKAAARGEAGTPQEGAKKKVDVSKATSSAEKQQSGKNEVVRLPEFGIIGHLPPFVKQTMLTRCPRLSTEIHPAILSLGLRYASGEIDGANLRCVAMLAAFKQAIADYCCPMDAAVSRDLDKKLKSMIQFLIDCRPLSVSMGAAIKHIRAVVSRLGPEVSEAEAKATVGDAIDAFVNERIVLPGAVIAERGADKIHDGDVVLTFGAGGDSVRRLLELARGRDIAFRVVVVDARPKLAGRSLLPFLHALNIETTYVLLNAVAYAMREVTTVFVGADALFSNGAALAEAGTAAVALVANTANVPVLVCCESYKFHSKVQLDSLSWNELGDPDHLLPTKDARLCKTTPEPPDTQDTARFYLRFDVTPDKYITAVITEHGLVPPSACAALVRELELGDTQPDSS